jgi:hypothetical protein
MIQATGKPSMPARRSPDPAACRLRPAAAFAIVISLLLLACATFAQEAARETATPQEDALADIAQPDAEQQAEELPFGRKAVRDYVANQLSELAGRELRIDGDFDVDLGWKPTVRVEQVRFANADWGEAPHLLALDALEVTLDMRALLDGRVVLPKLRLIGPKLFLEVSADGEANWVLKGEEETVLEAAAPEPTPGEYPQVHELIVTEGELAYRDASAANPRWIRGRIAQAGGRVDEEAVAFAATGTLGEDDYSLVLRTGPLAELRAGPKPQPFLLVATTGPSRLRAEGTVVAPFELRGLDLRVSAQGPGLDQLPLLHQLPESPPFDLSLHVVRDEGPWRFQRFAGSIGQSRLTGELTFAPAGTRAGPRPRISGTLDAETLAVAELLALAPQAEAEPPEAPDDTGDGLDPSVLRALDAELVCTAETLRYEDLELTDVEVELTLDDGRLSVDPLAADAGGGRIVTELDLQARPLQGEAQLELSQIDLSQALAALELPGPELGIVGGKLALVLPAPDEPRPARASVEPREILARLRVEQGRLDYRVPGQDTQIVLRVDARGRVTGPSVQAHGRWRGATLKLALDAEPLPKLLGDETYAFDGQLRLGETSGDINGALLAPPGLEQLRLRFDLRGDPAQLATLIETPLPELAQLDLASLLRRDGARWIVEDLAVAAADSDLSGRIAFDTGQARPRIDAQLTSDTLDIPKLAEALATGEEKRDAGLAPVLGEVDAQVDFSADRILLGGPRLSDVDLSAWLDDGRLTLGPIGGTFRQPEADTRVALELDPVSGKGPEAARHLSGSASGQMGGRPIDADIRLDNEFGLTEGPAGDWSIALETADTEIGRSGELRDLLTPRDLTAHISAKAPNTRGLSALLGTDLPAFPTYRLDARLVRDGPSITLKDLDGQVGESDLAGQIRIDMAGEGPPAMDAGLRSRTLDYDDLTSLLEKEAYGREGRQPWEPLFSEEPLGIEQVGEAVTGQIRWRAGTVIARQVPLDDLALKARIDPGHLRVDNLRFDLAGGKVRLDAVVDARKVPTQVELSGEVARVNLRAALAPFDIADQSFGKIAGQMNVWMQGNSIADLAGSADGGLMLLMTGGAFDSLLVEIAGVDPGEALFELFDARPVPIDCAFLNLRSRDGQVDIDTLSVDTRDTLFLGDGVVDLARERLRLTIDPRPKDRSILTFSSPVRLEGPLRDLGLDVISGPLLGRAGAAVVLGAIQPLAGLIPLIETGSDIEGQYCRGLMQSLKEAVK